MLFLIDYILCVCVCSYYNYNGLWKLVEVTEISASGFSIKVRQPGKALERTIYFSDFSPKLAEKGSKATDARIGEETELVDVEKIAAMERQVRINIFLSSTFELLYSSFVTEYLFFILWSI